MSKFKAGDKVRCVVPNTARLYLKQGEIYTVSLTDTRFGTELVQLEEIKERHQYTSNKFELYTYPNPPHVHAELIKAWADGAVIEFFNTFKGYWLPIDHVKPTWVGSTEYRIKPQVHTITIDGKAIEISAESLDALKASLLD